MLARVLRSAHYPFGAVDNSYIALRLKLMSKRNLLDLQLLSSKFASWHEVCYMFRNILEEI